MITPGIFWTSFSTPLSPWSSATFTGPGQEVQTYTRCRANAISKARLIEEAKSSCAGMNSRHLA